MSALLTWSPIVSIRVPRNTPGPTAVEHAVPTIEPRRVAAFHALWRALAQSRRPGAPAMDERLRALPRMLRGALSGRYPQMSRARLGMIVVALAYLVSPVDLVPEAFLALLGLTDDAVVALWLGGAFLSETDRFLDWERRQ